MKDQRKAKTPVRKDRQKVKGPIRVGLVGMSGIGNTHAASYKQDPLAKLVAVCDVVKEKADAAAAASTASRPTTA